MMKRVLAIVLGLCLLSGLSVNADIDTIEGSTIAGGEEGCTGDCTLILHFENSLTVTEGSPAGCSAGDTVITNSNATFSSDYAQEGTYSLLLNHVNDQTYLDITTDDIAFEDKGTIDLYFYLDTFASGRELIKLHGDAGNRMMLTFITNTDNELKLEYKGDGSGQDRTLTTTDCNLVEGEEIHIIAKWRQGETDPSMSIYCNSATGGEATITSNDDLPTWDVDAAYLYMGVGNGVTPLGKLDTMKVYKEWQ
jgi:hypothetical protein